MSASEKKKLRHEQYATQMSEKQKQEVKEAKKLRLYTILFAVVIALMICVVIATSVMESGIIQRNTTAATVNDTKISAAELNHYYMDSVNQFTQQFGNYLALSGIDTTKPLDEQVQDEETGATWADYFMETATNTMKRMYAVYNEAVAQGYTLSEEAASDLDMSISNMGAYAKMYGYPDADSYIKAIYGKGCNEKTYRKYAEVQLIASEFSKDHSEALNYDDAALREADAEDPSAYSSFSYNSYFLPASRFYEGGTKAEDGNVTYSEEEMAAGLAACKAAADELLAKKPTSVEELDSAIAALPVNAETEAASTAYNDTLFKNVNGVLRDWVTDANRAAGDVTVIANETETAAEDGTTTKTTNGYYVVYFTGSSDNNFPLVNVRHILLPYEGGTTDANGQTTYTDEEKAATKAKAEELLAQFTAGEATEDAFAALANEKSTDTGSNKNGGLYENIYPGQMVPTFNDWCFAEGRKAGDTGIVESDYGVHIMYFVGNSDVTYRDYMITNNLRDADMLKWQDELTEKVTVTLTNTSNVKTDLVLGGNK